MSIRTEPTASTRSAERSRPLARLSWTGAGLALALLLGALLRFHDLGIAPGFLDNADEVGYAWAGLGLIAHHDAYTWSYLNAYKPDVVLFTFQGAVFPMVHHWMDHPPGFALVVGGFAWLLGDRGPTNVTAGQIRIVPALLSVAALGLVYVLGRRLLGAPAAAVGALLLATAPGAVLLDRQVESESLLAVVLLTALILSSRIVDGEAGRLEPVALFVCCLVAPFVKVPGVAVGGSCALALAASGRWRPASLALAGAAGGLFAYLVYGAIVDWQLFVRVFTEQSQVRSGVMAAYEFIASPAGANRRLRDGWWLLGWLGLALWLVEGRDRRRDLLLAWPAAAYLLAMLVMAGEMQAGQYGWYRVTVLPLVYLAAGHLVWRAVAAPSLGRLAVVLALGGATATEKWLIAAPGDLWLPSPALLSLLLAAVLVPAAVAVWRGTAGSRRAAQVVAAVAVGLMVVGNVAQSAQLAALYPYF